MSSYLFVLYPPYSGSTVLWKLLSTSDNVSAFPSEGQFLPELKDIMRESPWRRDHQLPWEKIKAVWERYWDHDKAVLLEKSPPNLIRTAEIVEHFQPVKFVIMVRNPYAHAEGLMRRNGWPPQRAANFSCMCLRTQWENSQQLQDKLMLTYEQLVADPAGASQRMAAFLPPLSDMDASASFEVHSVDGTVDRPITDLNAKKIASLDAATIAELNEYFEPNRETLAAWGYDLIDPATNG